MNFGNDVFDRLESRDGAQRVPHAKVQMFRIKDFLSADECDRLCEMIEARRRPSTLSDDSSGDPGFRTSETCDMVETDPLVLDVTMRFTDWLGIPPEFGEPLQGQRYLVGQEFKAHTDYFDPSGLDLKNTRQNIGQRTWTAMVYLNEVEAGGATRFKAMNKTIQPTRGMCLTWNNQRPDGTVNPTTIHHALKVRTGRKYVLTKWFSERPWPWPRGWTDEVLNSGTEPVTDA